MRSRGSTFRQTGPEWLDDLHDDVVMGIPRRDASSDHRGGGEVPELQSSVTLTAGSANSANAVKQPESSGQIV